MICPACELVDITYCRLGHFLQLYKVNPVTSTSGVHIYCLLMLIARIRPKSLFPGQAGN